MDDEVIEYLNQNFGTLESMAGLEKAILDFDLEIQCVDTEIKNVIREQALAAEAAREHMSIINTKSTEMINTIKSLKQRTSSAQNIIKDGCSEIKRLDTVKRNITFSITSLKRLIMLSKSSSLKYESLFSSGY